jgi:GTP:adenosylcobinamide-phosphate guanylyltransferase
MNTKTDNFTGVVLAADRGTDDPVAQMTGAPCKSFVPVGGRAMVLRVLDALGEAREIGPRMVCGPSQALLPQAPELHARIVSNEIRWMPHRETPSSSTCHVLDSLPHGTPVLVTTSDHALLRAEIVDYFCREALAGGCDVVVGLASHKRVMQAYPETRRTAIQFQGGGVCSCNLFAFLTPRSRRAAELWQKVETHRKKPLRVVRFIGWTVVLRYLLRRLSLEEGFHKISEKMDLKAGAILLPFPEAAIDVDTVEDWRLVEKIISARSSGVRGGAGMLK